MQIQYIPWVYEDQTFPLDTQANTIYGDGSRDTFCSVIERFTSMTIFCFYFCHTRSSTIEWPRFFSFSTCFQICMGSRSLYGWYESSLLKLIIRRFMIQNSVWCRMTRTAAAGLSFAPSFFGASEDMSTSLVITVLSQRQGKRYVWARMGVTAYLFSSREGALRVVGHRVCCCTHDHGTKV